MVKFIVVERRPEFDSFESRILASSFSFDEITSAMDDLVLVELIRRERGCDPVSLSMLSIDEEWITEFRSY